MKSIFLSFLFFIISTSGDDKAAQEVINGNNLFALEVYKQLTKTEKENFLVSPFSAEIVLSLLQSGCKGPTAEELRKGLYLPNNSAKIEAGYERLLPKLQTNESFVFRTANKVYVLIKFPIKDSFKKVATRVYYADYENVDFSKNVETAEKINKWVEEHTNNKIKNIISPESLSQNTVAILVNALYFKASWAVEFPKAFTKQNKFFKTETDVVQIETMYNYRKYFKYFHSCTLKTQFLQLWFEGGEASMIVVLPDAISGLSQLEQRIDQIKEIVTNDSLKSTYLNVALPKFKLQTEIDFKPILSKMGINKIFDSGEADLSGIAGKKGELSVYSVIQKTYADVNEEGVEAAAATTVVVGITSVVQGIPKNFTADHPFIICIVVKGIIVFVGRITDPQYKY